jgi:hypothetical protein
MRKSGRQIDVQERRGNSERIYFLPQSWKKKRVQVGTEKRVARP